jgi:hypothetical protein
MSLRTALAALPDDRPTASVIHEVVAFFSAHSHDQIGLDRVVRATGFGEERVEPVLSALCSGGVLHCDGDFRLHDCSFDPDHVLALEIERYLRSSGSPNLRLQASVGKYRNRLGSF